MLPSHHPSHGFLKVDEQIKIGVKIILIRFSLRIEDALDLKSDILQVIKQC